MNDSAGPTPRTPPNAKRLLISAGRIALLVATVLLVNYGAKQGLYDDKGQRLFVMLIAVSANVALLFLTTTRAERTAMWQKGRKQA